MAIGGEAMLTESVHAYLSIRRAGGFTLHADEHLLLNFARYATERGEDHVRTTTAIEWAAGAKSLRQCGIRLRTLTRFARHVRAEDSEHQLPPDHVFAAPIYRRLPHIFEPEEIYHILEVAGKMGPAGSLQPWTYQTLFGLLASCGLRISEAIALKVEDMTEDGLIIRNTKFRKTRLVPMHETTEGAMKEYLKLRQTAGGSTDHFFVSPEGKPLRYPTVSRELSEDPAGARATRGKGAAGPPPP
jgi:integrase/recombinase XerD